MPAPTFTLDANGVWRNDNLFGSGSATVALDANAAWLSDKAARKDADNTLAGTQTITAATPVISDRTGGASNSSTTVTKFDALTDNAGATYVPQPQYNDSTQRVRYPDPGNTVFRDQLVNSRGYYAKDTDGTSVLWIDAEDHETSYQYSTTQYASERYHIFQKTGGAQYRLRGQFFVWNPATGAVIRSQWFFGITGDVFAVVNALDTTGTPFFQVDQTNARVDIGFNTVRFVIGSGQSAGSTTFKSNQLINAAHDHYLFQASDGTGIASFYLDAGNFAGIAATGGVMIRSDGHVVATGGTNDQQLQLYGFNATGGKLALTGDTAYFVGLGISLGDGQAFSIGNSSGSVIGGANSKFAFWGAGAVAQQVLATGTGKTVDNVITLLQTLGLCKQS